MAAERGPRPEGDEQHEEGETIGRALLRGHGIEGTYHIMYPGWMTRRSRPGEAEPAERGQLYLMKLASKRSSTFGAALMMPISSSSSAASLLKARKSPAKNFWFAALSCQRRYFAELPNCSPDCLTSAPMIS